MEYIVDLTLEGTRLDRFLRKKYENRPLTEIFKAIRTGKIKVNNKKVKENYRLKIGDIIKVFLSNEEKTKEREWIKLTQKEKEILQKGIVFENKDIIIFNKKSGMVMHKGSGYKYGLSEMFKSYYKTNDFNFVNRIDKLTSGLVIGAKNLIIARELAQEIKERNVIKKYYILVEGVIKEKEFIKVSFLKKNETEVVELNEYEEGAKVSKTQFKVIDRSRKRTILEATLETGRTHQLRVQLSSMKHPIVGDLKYGNKDCKMFLYSYYCKISKYNIEIKMPLPEEFKDYL